MPTLMVLPSVTPSVTHTTAPTLTPLVNITQAEPTITQSPTETPTNESQATRSIRIGERASETTGFTPTFTSSPTRTPTSTSSPTRTVTNTATRTPSVTITASLMASGTATRTPVPTLPLPATVTPTVIITRIVQPPHTGEDPQIGGINTTFQPRPTLPIPIPSVSIIPTSTPSMMPTLLATSTPSSGQPPTLGVTNVIVMTPVSGAPGESQPPPGAGLGLPTALPPSVINPPIPVNPSPTLSE
jgi:hypothetical protein